MTEHYGTVLVVEDDADIMLALTQRLRLSGFDAIPAPDGRSALVVGRRRSVAAAVVDVNLPLADGFEVAKALLDADTAVIMMTAMADPELRERAAELGCAGFVQKPFTGAFLVDRIKQALRLG